MNAKSPTAMRTIGEVAAELGIPTHVLRFWEARFPEVAPLTRAGGRRYYRAGEVALLRAIARLTREQGMTLRGVERLLAERGATAIAAEYGGDGDVAAKSDWRVAVTAARDRLAEGLAAYRAVSSI